MGKIKLNSSSSLPRTKKEKKIGILEIEYDDTKIKQYSKVTHFGCELDEILSGETMTLKAIKKVNGRPRFFERKNRFLSSYLQCYYYAMLQFSHISIIPAQLGIQIRIKNPNKNYKLFKRSVFDFVFN